MKVDKTKMYDGLVREWNFLKRTIDYGYVNVEKVIDSLFIYLFILIAIVDLSCVENYVTF